MEIKFNTQPYAEGMGAIIVDGREYRIPAQVVAVLAEPYSRAYLEVAEYFIDRATDENNDAVVEWFDKLRAEAESEQEQAQRRGC